jgi:hypothetical protein
VLVTATSATRVRAAAAADFGPSGSSGRASTAPRKCFASFADVLTHTGGGAVDVAPDVTPANASRETLMSSDLLGVHCENAGLGGSSFTVWGSSCVGGGLPLSRFWNDRISSTAHGLCNTIKHYEHSNYTGAIFTTTAPWQNITGVMNDKTSALTYH